jgi:SAM-dependent methyltransferase
MSDHPIDVRCQACDSPNTRRSRFTCETNNDQFGRTLDFIICEDCNFHFAPGNTHSYSSKDAFDADPYSAFGRVGTGDKPGREFSMARMGKQILGLAGKDGGSILLFGAGLSKDHAWLRKEFPLARVSVCDLENFQGIDNFVPIDSDEKFDILVACECIEHFTDLESDFSTLLSKMSKDGIAIFSTNINDGAGVSKRSYPFIVGHTSYYSGRALQKIAKRIDGSLEVDFRSPLACLGQLGGTKRYVIMHSDHAIREAISEYFATHLMADSEPIVHPTLALRVRRFLHRKVRNNPVIRSVARANHRRRFP